MAGGHRSHKLLAFALGGILALVSLEGALRLGGAEFLLRQRHQNRLKLRADADVRVLCLGESTTALGGVHSYPSQLEKILDARDDSRTYAVVNRGRPGADSGVILRDLASDLDAYVPDVVVVMMGANDAEVSPIGVRGAVPPRRQTDRIRTVKLARLLWLQIRLRWGSLERAAPPVIQEAEPRVIPAERRDQDAPPPAPTLVEARRFVQQGELDRGEAILREWIAADPGAEEAYLELGACHEARGRVDEALALYGRCAEQNPTSATGHLARARLLRSEGDREGALGALARAGEVAPGSVDVSLELGSLRMEEGLWDEAEVPLRAAHAAAPDRVDVLLALARWQEDQGAMAEAEALLRRAADRQRKCPAYSRLVEFWARRDQADAIEDLAGELNAGRVPDLPPIQRACLDRLLAGYLDPGGDEHRRRLAEDYYGPETAAHFSDLGRQVVGRGVPLVCVQYPGRELEPLVRLLDDPRGVVFVDNEPDFREALERQAYADLFLDDCYGDFGHATAAGNRILADNIADAILELTLDPVPR